MWAHPLQQEFRNDEIAYVLKKGAKNSSDRISICTSGWAPEAMYNACLSGHFDFHIISQLLSDTYFKTVKITQTLSSQPSSI